MKVLFTFFFALSCLSAAPQSKPDSLLALLDAYPARDTVRVNLLNRVGYEFWVINAARSERYGTEALALARELEYPEGTAMAHRVIGVSHWSRGNFYAALNHLFEARNAYREIGDRIGEANAVLNIGLVYDDQFNHDEALKHYFEALHVFERFNRSDRQATTFAKIGTAYIEKGKYREASDYLNRSLTLHQQNRFEFGLLEVHNRLGILHTRIGEYEKAVTHLQESLALSRKRKDPEHVVKNLENLARLALEQNQTDRASEILAEALPLARASGHKKWLRDILYDLKDLSSRKNDFRSALAFHEQYDAVRDSLFNASMALQLADLQIAQEMREREYNSQLRQQEIKFLKEQSESDRLLAAALGALLLFSFAFGIIVYRNQRFRLHKKEEILQRNRELLASKEKLVEAERENARLKEQELNRELMFRNKELTSYTLNFIQKNELFESLKEKLEHLRDTVDAEARKEINALLRTVQANAHVEKNWEDFRRSFEQVHHDFFRRLLEHCPELTQTDLKLCAMIRLNLSMKEAAAMMGIATDSVKTARYRLRKKLRLNEDQTLTDFLMTIGEIESVSAVSR